MQPKPGDPDFVPRYPPIDLATIERRIAERRVAARGVMNETTREVVEADTDMMEELVQDVKNKVLALESLRNIIRKLTEAKRE
jgi:N-methylhydantoinase B/oxoprolinase/acetone carboxylase alpha subunit